jgi:hypothetical protein
MLKKILLAASTTAAALGFSSGAFASPPHWAPAHGYRAHYEHARPYYVAPRPVYVAPRPVYVVPAPRVVYAAPPAPVYYTPAPAYSIPGVSIRLNFPL